LGFFPVFDEKPNEATLYGILDYWADPWNAQLISIGHKSRLQDIQGKISNPKINTAST